MCQSKIFPDSIESKVMREYIYVAPKLETNKGNVLNRKNKVKLIYYLLGNRFLTLNYKETFKKLQGINIQTINLSL